MCLPRGIKYSLTSALSARITILRMPFTNPPISTRPSPSVMTACSLCLRPSNRPALDDVLVLDPPRELREDRVGERIPLDQHGPRLDPLVGLHLDLGAVDDRIPLALTAAVVGHADLAVTVRRDQVAVAVHD